MPQCKIAFSVMEVLCHDFEYQSASAHPLEVCLQLLLSFLWTSDGKKHPVL